ncbi:MAG: peptidoglycan editing factor PgeF [Candidatus Anoxymicrobium japonicum]|uniref:Purine nucleoside phosphorylase n=1 Tax=Candidatus Anoxymicrobium japonicum TaxID=2013648 RepID=A0A2N3G7A9_9ACTN|nr:MAG: peptidoglycan editing factor PgeF [Candidatus Anoxymicrobium japonicum]
MFEQVERNGVRVLTSTALEAEVGVRVAFTGRASGAAESLNVSYNVGDDPSLVARNRGLVSEALELPLDRWVLGQQVHGRVVTEVGPLEVGRGAREGHSALPGADGLVTSLEDVSLAVLTADCVPLIFVAPLGNTIGVVHAGWRGVLAGIVSVGLRNVMWPAAGMKCLVGPHIGPCCMDVSEDVADAFEREFHGKDVVQGSKRRSLDLFRACSSQLLAAGVREKDIFNSGFCTMCSGEYFSYRADASCGRQMSIACIVGAR